MSDGIQYVAAAHGVVLAALLVYVVVVAMRAGRLGREVELLSRLTAGRTPGRPQEAGERPPVDAEARR